MFSVASTVKLHHTDAAGVLFFVNYFKIAHDAYEEFLEAIGLDIAQLIDESPFLLLIAHAEADYKKPQRVGDKITVEIRVERIGNSSFTLAYRIIDALGDEATLVNTVHAALDKKSGKVMRLPEDLKAKLEKFQ